MGVQGLWQLIHPVARPIKLETLEGKRLAIDSSIWLYHFQMAMRDREGRTLSNAHILGFLWRILKLLFHGIRPVFVFDGGAPVMKRKTLANRKTRRQGAKESHARTAEKLLAAQLRQAAVKHISEGQSTRSSDRQQQSDDQGLADNTVYFDDLDQGRPQPLNVTDLSASGPASAAYSNVYSSASASNSQEKPKKPDYHRDPYQLPALERELHTMSAVNGRKGQRTDYRFATESELRQVMSSIAPEDLDTEYELFQSLPPELQYELVGDLRAQSRMTSYKRLQSMLASAPTPIDFSRAQIAGLKTRNDLTQKVLTVTDEIGSANIKVPIRIASERNKEYVLVRNPGSAGGFVLGVRDAGTSKEKAITVEDDDDQPKGALADDDVVTVSDSDAELEMDTVEIPEAPGSATGPSNVDPEAVALRKEADPLKRKEKALEILEARARLHKRQLRKEAGLVDNEDDDDQTLALRNSRARSGDQPLFMKRLGKKRDSAPIDLASDDDSDDDGRLSAISLHHTDSEIGADEAEDLSRALEESRQDSNFDVPTSNHDQISSHTRPLYGIGLQSRGGEPVSLHSAMRSGSYASSDLDRISKPNTAPQTSTATIESLKEVLPLINTSTDSQVLGELSDTDFEDVNVDPPEPIKKVIPASGSGSSMTKTESAEAKAGSNRMEELANLLRAQKNGETSPPVAPPPRKSLAGSLRAARLMDSAPVADSKVEEDSAFKPVGNSPPVSLAKAGPGIQKPSPPLESQIKLEPGTDAVKANDLSETRVSEEVKAVPQGPEHETIRADSERRELWEPLLNLSTTSSEKTESPEQEHYSSETIAEVMSTPKAPLSSLAEEGSNLSQSQAGRVRRDSPPTIVISTSPAESPEAALHPAPESDSGQDEGEVGLARDERQSVEPALLPNDQDHTAASSSQMPTSETKSTVEDLPAMEAEKDAPLPRTSDSHDSDDGTPIEWSPSPSPEPVAVGADGFPLPTAEELEAMDAEDEEEIARLNADQNEFAAFLSATKGRSLLDVQQEVEEEVNALRAEHANSRRSEEDITRQMAQEIQMMLRLFGLPYITAPMEAEAQCAELVSRRLVDGIITDDSDVFLFGGTRIYKNMFNNNKVVECFLLSDMQRELGLDREKLVRLAYYLGSDYTDGLPGVGPVLAMELLALFPGEDGLLKFRDWWLKVQMGRDTHEDTRGKTMRRIKKSLRNKVHLAPSWPEPEVLDAYYQPRVDESDEPFQWGLPDLDSLRTFLGEYLHWPASKTDQYLLPIIEKQNQRSRARGNQSTLDRNGFFDTTAGLGVYAGRKKPTYGSNRLQEVVNGFRAATKARTEARKRRAPDEATSSEDESSDGIEIVDSTASRTVPEELLGKEMGKRRPVVRRQDAQDVPISDKARAAELDAAVEALEGSRPTPSRGRGKGRGAGRCRGGGRASERGQKRARAGSSSSSADEWRPAPSTGADRGRGRGRGQGRGRGRGKTTGSKAALHAARNMSLDDVGQLPPSRSPSVGPAAMSRRSSSTSSSAR